MDDLIIRYLGGHASRFEAERLKQWRDESRENESYFQDVARVWELTAPEPGKGETPAPRAEDLLGTASDNLGWVTRIRTRPLARWGLLAASVAALAIGVQTFRPSTPEPFATHQAPEDRSLTVTLADGSFARLAPGSTLEEFENPQGRDVALKGRGFFAVARDETRPFTVRAGSGEVRVLGTRFQVEERTGGEIRTAVVEGRVAVSNQDGSVEIGAGQMAQASEGSPPTISQPEDIYAFMDWPDGVLVFQGTPLSHVAQEVSRHFRRPIQVVGEEIRNRRVTAWFGTESFEEVAESLCLVTEALCDASGEGMVMSPMDAEGSLR